MAFAESHAAMQWSVWLIGQVGWKLHCRPRFDSWQFKTQAEKCRWAGNCKFANLGFFKTWIFNPILKFTYLTASFHCFLVLAKAMQWTFFLFWSFDWCLSKDWQAFLGKEACCGCCQLENCRCLCLPVRPAKAPKLLLKWAQEKFLLH